MSNLTNIYNVTDMAELFTEFNTASNDVLLGMILFIQFVLIFIIFKNWDTVTVWLINGFVGVLISTVFVIGLGWGDKVFIVVPFTMMGLAMLVAALKKS